VKKSILFILLGMLFLLTACSGKEKEAASKSVEEPKSTDISVYGEVIAPDTKDYYIDFPATVQEIFIKEGMSVKKGDKLIKLNLDSFNNDIDKKTNEVKLKDLELQSTIASIDAKEKELAVLKAERNEEASRLDNNTDFDIQLKQSNLDKVLKDIITARENYENNKKLYDAGAISKAQLDEVKNILDTKEKEEEDILTSIEKLKKDIKEAIYKLDTSVGYLEAEIKRAKGGNTIASESQKTSKEDSERDLSAMKNKLSVSYIDGENIVSDIENGIISKISCVNGSIVGVNGASYLLSIIDADKIEVMADVPEEFIKDVKTGAECEIYPYYDKLKIIKGKVTKISEMAIKQNGENIIKVYISFDKQDDLLEPGFSVDVKIDCGK